MTILVPGQFTTPSSSDHHAPDLRLVPEHLTMRLDLDLEARSMEVELQHRICCQSAGADRLVLNGVELLDMRVEGEGVGHHYDGEEIELVWETPFSRDEVRNVTLRYRGERDGSLTVRFRSGEVQLRASLMKDQRRGALEERLRASTKEFRQNYLYVRGTITRGPRGLRIVPDGPESWRTPLREW